MTILGGRSNPADASPPAEKYYTRLTGKRKLIFVNKDVLFWMPVSPLRVARGMTCRRGDDNSLIFEISITKKIPGNFFIVQFPGDSSFRERFLSL